MRCTVVTHATPHDVARWMLDELQRHGQLSHLEAVLGMCACSAPSSCVRSGTAGRRLISRVLKVCTSLSAEAVIWDRAHFCGEKKMTLDCCTPACVPSLDDQDRAPAITADLVGGAAEEWPADGRVAGMAQNNQIRATRRCGSRELVSERADADLGAQLDAVLIGVCECGREPAGAQPIAGCVRRPHFGDSVPGPEKAALHGYGGQLRTIAFCGQLDGCRQSPAGTR